MPYLWKPKVRPQTRLDVIVVRYTQVMDRSPPVSVPRLRTRRLLLREYRVDDFELFAAHLADPETTAFIGSADRQTAWRIFGCHAGLWLLDGAGWWAVEHRETGQPVGAVGAFFREHLSGIEIGWNTYRAFWGQGIAGEAAAEAVRYALEIRGERQVRALIDPHNEPSIRVALRLGMRFEMETELYGKATRRYIVEREARLP
jgi:RimJ/RimL family protein N-acetyltransferase